MVDPMPVEKKRDLFPGALELMVLRTLALEALHGYALAMRIQQRSD
jgi:PadR family transcriptional regulator PadR